MSCSYALFSQNLDGSFFSSAGSSLITQIFKASSTQEQLCFKEKLAVLFPRSSKLEQQKFLQSIERFDLNSIMFTSILKRELGLFHHNTRTAFVKFTDYWLRFGRDDAHSAQATAPTFSVSQQVNAADQLYSTFLEQHRDQATSRVLCIISVAGNGKSVLFSRLCHIYALDLIAVHVCKYSIPRTRDPIQFVQSIIAQLAKNLAPFAEALGVVEESIFKDKTATDLWTELIVTPLKKCESELVTSRRKYIAIDGLDGELYVFYICVCL
jgi:hypothetical protein